MSSPPLFSISGVRLEIDGHTVLDGIDAEFAAHRIVVLAGPSGSGKSSLLRLCNRLERPTAGTVEFEGVDVATLDVAALRRRVGMVFQRPTPFPGTVAENLRVADPALADDACVELLASVGLDESFLDRDALALSGGEAQRVCTARSLATRPEVVLMDEPTSALDEDHARGLEQLARALVDGGVSIVWVTHDRAQLDRIADDVIRLDHGRVVEA
ncbi:MAG: phosphate ABC transporter ATP-binding protein [Acidimicrobiales bacterium]